jgi:serine/threonine-protein kinase RsbW
VARRCSDTHSAVPWTERTIPTRLDAIREAERDVLGRLGDLGYDEDARFAVRLACEEALINAMKHGNQMDPSLNVRLAYRISPECAEILVADEGKGFDPCCVPDPTADENLQRPCGRGIMLIRSYMDEVTYCAGGNEVRMVKYRGAESPD